MSHEASIHQTQVDILRELLFTPDASFSDLRKVTGLESDHFKFHIGRLNELGYVERLARGRYSLSAKGKEYANKLDTDERTIERQPKSAVILVIEHEGRYLVQERLKHPYFGYYGFPGGKIRWGETIIEAGQRELLEETGLAAELTYRGVYHEHVQSAEDGNVIEDKIFHVVYGTDPTNELIENFEGGRNVWMTLREIADEDKVYKSFDIELAVGTGQKQFVEATQIYAKHEF
ncbi:MAG: putative hydrolase [Candidatus Saccharibacteria bacterium]|nr:putative hydrolase [Candidatus Saccharibacteria bacterium]